METLKPCSSQSYAVGIETGTNFANSMQVAESTHYTSQAWGSEANLANL